MMQSLERRLRAVADLPGLRVVILTGAGRAFCAGGDLIEFEAALKAGGTKLIDTLRYNQDVIQMVEDLPVPVIGAVNGVAVAGGLELLLACDIIIAAEDAKIGDGHAQIRRRAGRRRDGEAGRADRSVARRAALLHGLSGRCGNAEGLGPGQRGRTKGPADGAGDGDRARYLPAQPGSHPAHQGTDRPAGLSDTRATRIRAELERFEEHIRGVDLAKGLAAFRTKQDPVF